MNLTLINTQTGEVFEASWENVFLGDEGLFFVHEEEEVQVWLVGTEPEDGGSHANL